MIEISNQNSESNDESRARPLGEGATPGRCSLVRQWQLGRHPTTVRTKWSKKVIKIVMECFFRSKPFDDDSKPIRGCRQRMMQEWKEHGVLISLSYDYVTKQELLGKMVGSLIWGLKIFGG